MKVLYFSFLPYYGKDLQERHNWNELFFAPVYIDVGVCTVLTSDMVRLGTSSWFW